MTSHNKPAGRTFILVRMREALGVRRAVVVVGIDHVRFDLVILTRGAWLIQIKKSSDSNS